MPYLCLGGAALRAILGQGACSIILPEMPHSTLQPESGETASPADTLSIREGYKRRAAAAIFVLRQEKYQHVAHPEPVLRSGSPAATSGGG
jgi:hypothetical protein